MVKANDFLKFLKRFGFSSFLMVPCSIFEPFNNCFLKEKIEIIFPPNEAHAMGFAVGSYTTTNKPAIIFMQNSGLNNIANAQTSLHALYKIPVLLVISWRGEKPEAPEHDIMGKNLKKFLKTLDIPFEVLTKDWKKEIRGMISLGKKEKRPTAIIVRKSFFTQEKSLTNKSSKKYSLSRFEAIKIIKESLKDKAVFISTNGHSTRDSFAVLPSADFYMMGSMGHAFSIGVGTAQQLKKKKTRLKTVVFDGDGGCLMHLGSLALAGEKNLKKSNLVYVVLDNEAYESTGSQPSLSTGVNFAKIARGLGFSQVFSVKTKAGLKRAIKNLKPNLVSFVHVKVNRKKLIKRMK